MAKRTNRAPWILVLMILITAGLYFVVSDNNSKTPKGRQQVVPNYNLEKTGAGSVVDYSAASQKVHKAVDSFIGNANLKLQDVKEANKEIPRQQVEGTIRWHTRQILVSMSGTDLDTIRQRAAAEVNGVGGEVFDAQPDNYQGLSVVRLDIGLTDNLAGDVITVITDRVYIQQEKVAVEIRKPPVSAKGEMAIVIDDFGYSSEPINAFAAIDRPLTFAVLPYRSSSNEAATRGISSGHQVMLHLPMEPLAASEQSERITIGIGMGDTEIRETVSRAIQAIPGIIGINNHQGSRATADQRVMRQVLSVIKANSLFFVDSRTNSKSVGVATARQLRVKTAANDLFIDNDNDVAAVKRQLRIARDMALRDGSVIVIGHARLTTAAAIQEMITELEESGIKLVFVSDMVR